jgi:glutathione S-transferase
MAAHPHRSGFAGLTGVLAGQAHKHNPIGRHRSMAKSGYTLVVGTKQYSSWSLRPWLAMRQAGIGFEEVLVDLRQASTTPEILKHSRTGLVPILKHGELAVWDSLAIAEYLNEQHPEANLWPADREARAHARSVSAEMHSGFRELRMALSMEFTARGLKAEINEGCAKDIRRIVRIWQDARAANASRGPFLFGAFTIADAMFAPVASRFTSYILDLKDYGDDGSAAAFRDHMMALPAMREWAAGCEPWRKDQQV